MFDNNELCEKIKALHPDIGECDIDLNVDYDKEQQSWVVHMQKGHKKVKHFLPDEDADACMEGKQCVSLGIEIAQFK